MTSLTQYGHLSCQDSTRPRNDIAFRYLANPCLSLPVLWPGVTTSADCGDCAAGKYSTGTGELLLMLKLVSSVLGCLSGLIIKYLWVSKRVAGQHHP